MNKNNDTINNWKSYNKIYFLEQNNKIRNLFIFLFIVFIVMAFMPWTQNISAKGSVTAFNINERTQQLNAIISGSIEKWYIKEGDYVKKGDTILKISEIKSEYLDPNLLQRTQEQMQAKADAASNYSSKASTANTQMNALEQALKFKMQQINNKIEQTNRYVEIDNANLKAAKNDFEIAQLQYDRQKKLFDEGLVSKTQLEQRYQTLQNAIAKLSVANQKIANSKQDLVIANLEKSGVEQDYLDKISKVNGEKFQSLSNISTAQGEISKLNNQYQNYLIRNGFYYIIAPQDGQVIKVKNAGLGEIIKETEMIAEIVPVSTIHSVEVFIKALDIPLLNIGQKVNLTFDGFPAIVFSGWPNASFGFFRGNVVAIESAINKDGYFRVLINEDISYKKWPQNLKYGSGANGIALLKDVPIYYEIWRQINGFPPDFYTISKDENTKKNKK